MCTRTARFIHHDTQEYKFLSVTCRWLVFFFENRCRDLPVALANSHFSFIWKIEKKGEKQLNRRAANSFRYQFNWLEDIFRPKKL